MKRIIVGLKWAKRLSAKPSCIPTSRPRGIKAYGARYERDFAKWSGLARSARGVWFEFEDKNGHGYCQVDFLLDSHVLELKHTWTEDGHVELEKLYLPVVEAATGRAHKGLVVTKKLVPNMKGIRVYRDFGEALEAKDRTRSVLLWIGGFAPAWRFAPQDHTKPLDMTTYF
jgi:hypothetical protein